MEIKISFDDKGALAVHTPDGINQMFCIGLIEAAKNLLINSTINGPIQNQPSSNIIIPKLRKLD